MQLTLPQNFAMLCSLWQLFSASICCRQQDRLSNSYAHPRLNPLKAICESQNQITLVPLCSEGACECGEVGA